MTMARSLPRAPLLDVTADDVAMLRELRGPALVSILATTTPHSTFGPDDRMRLNALVVDAEERVARECASLGLPGRPLDGLRDVIAGLAGARTRAGLALFERAGWLFVRRLPVTVDDRVVVDPTFATRDLARAVALHPPRRVLVLSRDGARVMILAAGRLDEHASFVRESSARTDRRGHRHDTDLSHRRADVADAFLKRVIGHLDEDRHTRALPLILVADVGIAARFRRWWRRPVAGVRHGNHMRTPRAELEALLAPLVDAARDADLRDARRALDRAVAERRAITDLLELWSLASRQRLHALYVEDGHRVPARVVAGIPVPSEDPARPGVIDDLVDDLVEHVLSVGGRVHWLPAGTARPAPLVGVRRTGG